MNLVTILHLPLSTQFQLDVAGDSKITGQLDLSSQGSNLYIGTDAGESSTTDTLKSFIGKRIDNICSHKLDIINSSLNH